MEKAVTNVTEKKSNKKQALKMMAVRAATVAACAAMCLAQTGLCSADTNTIVENLVAQVIVMMGYVGIVVCVIGVAKFALAMKDENPDGQTRAVYYAIAGAILIGIKPIISGLGIVTVK